MGRQPCCDKTGLKRGPWTIEEDQKLIDFIINNGIHCWRLVPKLAGLMRCGKSCRLRWTNYLRPDLKRGPLSEAEEDRIIELHSRLGNRWSKIASHFPGRTDNEIKNQWNTKIKKRLKGLGLDHVTHRTIERKEDDDKPMAKDVETQMKSLGGEKKEEDVLQQANNSSSSCITSLSIDECTLNISCVDGESSDDGFKYSNWADTIDSFPSWEALYYLDDVLSFGNFL